MVDTSTLLTLNDAVGDVNGTKQDAEAALDEVASLLGGVSGSDGWSLVDEAWSYASASTVTVPTDAADRFRVNDIIKFDNGGSTKYFIIQEITSATVLTLSGAGDYTVANSAITNIYLSRQGNPYGFPYETRDFFYSTSEIKTAKRWIDGSPVYRKTVSFGALPNATAKTVAHSIGVAFLLVEPPRFVAVPASGSGGIHVPYTDEANAVDIELIVGLNNVDVRTESNYSSYNGYCHLEYIKT